MRADGRADDALRPLSFELDVSMHAEGSCIVNSGYTRVFCTASIEEGLPRWRSEEQGGWVTAEYRMLPRATDTRSRREGDRIKGRTAEIQRLIGRALRAVVDFEGLGPRIITVDCDVLQADGGTRTAAINGGFVAMVLAMRGLVRAEKLPALPLNDTVGAVSVGILGGVPLLDLPYVEDAAAEVDMNVVMTGSGKLIEVQGTAEETPFTRAELDTLIDLAAKGIGEIGAVQAELLGLSR